MRLTRASSYALHAVEYMAALGQDKPVASHHIALARGIPERFHVYPQRVHGEMQRLHLAAGTATAPPAPAGIEGA